MSTDKTLGSAADALVAALIADGVRTFFGVPGGAISPVYDALRRRGNARVIHARHETGAAFMAAGHARAGGGLSAVLVTSGPGATNAITGFASAKADGVPLVAVAGEVPRSKYGRGALQEGSRYEIDVLGMAERTCVFAREVCTGGSAAPLARAAVRAATRGRGGPAFLLLPLDVANERVAIEDIGFGATAPSERGLDERLLERAARALTAARRPLVLLGSGARHPRTAAAVAALVDRLGAPVVTSPKAKGVFPESSPACLGVFGYGGHRSAADYVASRPDVVLAVGAGLGETSTNGADAALAGASCFIQVEVDATRVGRTFSADIVLEGRAETVLPALLDRLTGIRSPVRGPPPGQRGVTRDAPPDESSRDGIHPACAVRAVQQGAPAGTLFAADIGEHLLFAIHHLAIDRWDGFLAGLGLGSMGSGLCGAIGARVADPSRSVVSISGDFGFQMFGMELATCVHEGIGVVFVVFNDQSMRMVEAGMVRIFGAAPPLRGAPVDYAALARALGARGVRVETADELTAAVRDFAATAGQGPAVVDARIDPAAVYPNNSRVREISNFVTE